MDGAEHPITSTPQGPSNPAAPTAPAPKAESIGDNIGPYHLLEELGRGGFGVVYLAERRTPIIQRVALKVIKPGKDSDAVIARFEQERQALALLDHPNIAKVFDAGATALGRPYFVMELVRGHPISEYAAERGLPVAERLALFATVCHAVQNAHAHGLVHRDLKPSNILVTEVEGRPLAKVIDFGVVKALQATLTDKTVHTEEGQAIGTPEYMSPEQAGAPLEGVDARSDVYSLGVLLFELLTGELPYDAAKLRSAPAGSLSKVIEMLPVTRAGKLNRQLRGDIETVILRAMHKDRQRRYPSAGDLAADVERVLALEPIEARRDSAAYVVTTRLRRAARREHWMIVCGAALLSLLLMWYFGQRALVGWTGLSDAHRPLAGWAASRLRPPPRMDHAEVIVLTDANTPSELGALAGFDGVVDSDSTTLRPVHAEMIRRLAAARPKGVVLDIFMTDKSPRDPAVYDAPMGGALADLDRAGIPWAACLKRWPLDEAAKAADFILRDPAARYGGATLTVRGETPLVDAAMLRGLGEPCPSAAAVLFAQLQRPGLRASFSLDEREQHLIINYWLPDEKHPDRRMPQAGATRLPLTNVQAAQKEIPDSNVRTDDVVALYAFDVPAESVLSGRTMDYAQALRCDPPALAAAVRDRVVVLGDMRSGKDVRSVGGRTLGGSQLMGAALDAMIARHGVVTPDAMKEWELVLVWALLGGFIGNWLRGRAVHRWLVLMGVGAIMFAASAPIYAAGLDWKPMPPLTAMLIASETAALAARWLLARPQALEKQP